MLNNIWYFDELKRNNFVDKLKMSRFCMKFSEKKNHDFSQVSISLQNAVVISIQEEQDIQIWNKATLWNFGFWNLLLPLPMVIQSPES